MTQKNPDPAPTSSRQPVSAEQKILELTKDRDDWKHEWEIYKGAWLRELGGYFRNKHHLIDALVVSTRELRERANTVALERDELFAKNKKLLEAYRSASLPVQQAQPPRSREFTDAVRLANKILDRPSGDPDDDLAVLSRQFLRAIEPKPTTAAPSTPPASSPPTKKAGCNRHVDCKIADTIWREKHPGEKFIPMNFHCHDDECEDCFGC